MATNYSCDANTLITAAKCFSSQCIREHDRLAIAIYVLIQNLTAVGGTDYSADLNTLLQDSKVYQAFSKEDREAINLYISIENANFDGATVSTDPSVLRSAAACYECLPDETMRNVLTFLRCAINTTDNPA